MLIILLFLAIIIILAILLFIFIKKLALQKDDIVELQSELLHIDAAKTHLDEKILNMEKNIAYSKELEHDLKNRLSAINIENESLKTQITIKQEHFDEKIKLLENAKDTFKLEFENLANKIFEDKNQKFKEESKQSLGYILNPMKEQLKDFKAKVEDVYIKESKDRSALQQELKSLKELNIKMSGEAHNLTEALKGDKKKQGIWGEMVLEKILEKSGLRKNEEYLREKTLTDDNDKIFRPDVIVRLPDNRDIVIDAKTSLVAYEKYMSENDETAKNKHLKEHIKAVINHIDSLAIKDYEKLNDINSLDFIFMFIPIENALMLALENDTLLYDRAFKNKIILVSPTTLLLALRVVENTWKYEKQAKSITNIYSRAEMLYNKFVGFVIDLEEVGKSLNSANISYTNAFSKLKDGRGNLIGQVEKLKKISNLKVKKELKKDLIENALEQL